MVTEEKLRRQNEYLNVQIYHYLDSSKIWKEKGISIESLLLQDEHQLLPMEKV